MKMGRLAFRATALCTAVLSAVVVAGGPAAAAPSQCEPGWFCMWENNSYTGRFYALLNADSPNVGKDFNDKMTSYWNRSPHTYLAFRHSGYGAGCTFYIEPGESSAAVPTWGNDEITSVRRKQPGEDLFCQG